MPIRIGGHVIRNIPEQVGKNKKDIKSDSERITLLEEKVNEAIAGVFHYKGSVATYSDLPATGNEVGDTYNVLDTGNNFTWDGTGWDQLSGLVDLSAYYTKDETDTLLSTKANTNTENTFSMLQKMAAGLQVNASSLSGDYRVVCANNQDLSFVYYDSGISATPLKLYSNGDVEVGAKLKVNQTIDSLTSQMDLSTLGVVRYYLTSSAFYPSTNNYRNLGTSDYSWGDLHMGGVVNPNSSGFGLKPPNTSTWTTTKEIATTDSVFNVINATDIVSNTLTQEQLDLITNGKPTLIKGDLVISSRTMTNIFIISAKLQSGLLVANTFSTGVSAIIQQVDLITNANRVLSIGTSQYYGLMLNNIREINGKSIPAYPSNTGTFVLKCVDGTLTWVQE